MFLDFGLFKKLNFLPFCEQRYSTATQPGASLCALFADFAKSCVGVDLAGLHFGVHLREHAMSSPRPRVDLRFSFSFFLLVGGVLAFF